MATAKKDTTPASTDEKPVEKPKTDETPAAATTLDSSVEKPSVTAPGDGPADTTDPTERASSATPNPDETAIAAGTVNAVKPVPKVEAPKASGKSKDRVEKYSVKNPKGDVIKVTRNIETGETSVES